MNIKRYIHDPLISAALNLLLALLCYIICRAIFVLDKILPPL